ncbi:PKD domain-containing protein [Vibrio harveyi]
MLEFKNEILRLELEGTNIETIELEGLVVARKPIITDQPVGGMINDEQTITLSVVADGLGSTMTYQWYKSDGTAISGATGDSYEFTPLTTGSYSFYCRVDGFGGYTQTDTVTVDVEAAITAPVITKDPVGDSIMEGESYQASIEVSWNGEVGTIVWYLDDVERPNSNSTLHTFDGLGIGTHRIKAKATNSKGSDISAEAELIVDTVWSMLTVGDSGTEKPRYRGWNTIYGELTEPDFAVVPDGTLGYFVGADGIIEGNFDNPTYQMVFYHHSDSLENVKVYFGPFEADYPVADHWAILPTAEPDIYSYVFSKSGDALTGISQSIWNEIWNNVGETYKVKLVVS